MNDSGSASEMARYGNRSRSAAKRQALSALLMVAGVTFAWPAIGEDAEAVLLDRIVATIDAEPVFLSDIERTIALGRPGHHPEDGSDELHRRTLERIIDQRLRLRAAHRANRQPVPKEAVAEQVAGVADQIGGRAALETHLARLGMDEGDLRRMFEDQLRVLRHIDDRLRQRIFVGEDDVLTFFEQEIAPEARASRQTPPSLAEVRDAIRALLTERRLDQEIERWTSELRRRADIAVLLGQGAATLPPLVSAPNR